jgi:uncharacterized protein with HEPN domain
MRTDLDRLQDILEAIEHIEKYAEKGADIFDADELIQTWMVKHLENIGEACRAMSKDFRSAHPEIPWEDIVAQRTYLAHEYFQIDKAEVWDTIAKDIPELKIHASQMLSDLKRSNEK